MRSHILVSGVGSRNLHYTRLSKTDFDLILSNSNAGNRGWKHELLLVPAAAGYDQPALHLAGELDKQCLEVNWALTNLGSFFKDGLFFFFLNLSNNFKFACWRICSVPWPPSFAAVISPWSTALQASPLIQITGLHGISSNAFMQPPALLCRDKAIYVKKPTANSAGLCLDLCGEALNHSFLLWLLMCIWKSEMTS